MKKSRKDFELLAPAGSFESLKSSFAAGADAAYMGGLKFGARAYADSTGEDCIEKAIDYAHLRGKKLYLTVNTLLKEDELKKELFSYIYPYYEKGLDAVIVQDLGVMSFLHKEFPELALHASTQMTITGSEGALWAKNMGAERIVTAREMSLSDISDIKKNVDIEIETFIHGAMCYCYSGQCLMSSVIGGRSGNRGRCAQPCRLPYDAYTSDGRKLTEIGRNYILSLKDMCTIDMLPELMDAGVFSFKIEGRMKSPVYTAGVVSIYRKYMDMYIENGRAGFSVDKEDRENLLKLFDRGGQTDGYLKGIKGKSMMALQEKPAYREVDNQLIKDIEEKYISAEDKIKIDGYAFFNAGNEAILNLSCGEINAEVRGNVVLEAVNRPVTGEEIEKRLRKTGGTQFEFDNLYVDAGDNIFMPVKDINDLRRDAIEKLVQVILSKYHRKYTESDKVLSDVYAEINKQTKTGILNEYAKTNEQAKTAGLNAYVETDEQLKAVLASGKINCVYLDSAIFVPGKVKAYAQKIKEKGIKCVYVLPPVFKYSVKQDFEAYFDKIAGLFDGFVVKNIDEAEWIRKYTDYEKVIGDSSLYAYNSLSIEYLKKIGIEKFIMPLELNSKELAKAGHSGNELIVYGRMPLMVTEQCIVKNTTGCTGKPDVICIKDRKQMEFPVKNKCSVCCNIIYNSVYTSLSGCQDRIDRLESSAFRLDFTVETQAEARDVIEHFYKELILKESVGSLKGSFTKGHFTRGIE